MAYQKLSGIERKDFGGNVELLPPGAYVCVITEARISKSKKGEMALLVTWDVADGDHKGHFSGAQFGHTEWLMLEGGGAAFAAARLDKLTLSNSTPPVTFDAVACVDTEAEMYDAGGRQGEHSVPHLSGKYIGLVVGTETEEYKGENIDRNFVSLWITPDEAKAGKYMDSKGIEHDVKVPAHRNRAGKTSPAQQKTQTIDVGAVDEDIPF